MFLKRSEANAADPGQGRARRGGGGGGAHHQHHCACGGTDLRLPVPLPTSENIGCLRACLRFMGRSARVGCS